MMEISCVDTHLVSGIQCNVFDVKHCHFIRYSIFFGCTLCVWRANECIPCCFTVLGLDGLDHSSHYHLFILYITGTIALWIPLEMRSMYCCTDLVFILISMRHLISIHTSLPRSLPLSPSDDPCHPNEYPLFHA
eukprot:560014_1